MENEYTRGVAFILEGITEKVFYRAFLKWIAKNENCTFCKGEGLDKGDVYYEWNNGTERILIKYSVVGTVTQITHSGKWFNTKCAREHKVPWKVFLCYDTDDYEFEITKFYKGDWENLRKSLTKAKAEIIDLAASADIEDVILCDLEGVCNYLCIETPDRLSGRKGKAKMKELFRSCGNTYHSGEKVEAMIETLNFNKIIENGPIELRKLITALASK